MPKFKVGDRVKRIRDHFGGMYPEFEGTVVEVGKDGNEIRIKENEIMRILWHDANNFVLVIEVKENKVFGISFFMDSINKK